MDWRRSLDTRLYHPRKTENAASPFTNGCSLGLMIRTYLLGQQKKSQTAGLTTGNGFDVTVANYFFAIATIW